MSVYSLFLVVIRNNLNLEKATNVVKEITAKLGAEPWKVASFEHVKSIVLNYHTTCYVRTFVAQRKVTFRDFVPVSKLALT